MESSKMATGSQSTIAVQNDLTQRFRLGLAAGVPFYPNVCTEISSGRKSEDYGFVGAMPTMRKWLNDRVYNKLRAGRFAIENELWELSLEVLRTDIEDDQLGSYQSYAQDMGIRAIQHPDNLLLQIIEAGESTNCFDGQYFFDSDHVWGDSGTQSNLLTYAAASGTTPTSDEFRAAWEQSVDTLLSYKDDQGQSVNQPTVGQMDQLVCIVPRQLRTIAHKALDVAFLASGATNLILDRPRIVTMPGLTNAAKFFTIDTSGSQRPFVFQRRQAIRPPNWIDDPRVKFLQMVTDARYNIGYFAWWKATQTTFT